MTEATGRPAGTIDYGLMLMETEAGTGYFSCVPPEGMDDDACLDMLRACPNDAFMRRHLLKRISRWDLNRLEERLRETPAADTFLRALFFEAILLYDHFAPLGKTLRDEKIRRAASETPFIYLKSHLAEDQALHSRWIALFRDNAVDHRMLPPPEKTGLAPPFSDAVISHADREHPGIAIIQRKIMEAGLPEAPPRPPLEETTRIALKKLEQLGIIEGEVQRHVASLSPIALLRQWRVDVGVENGRHDYRVRGIQNSYGRGLALPAAQASLAMEMVERCSSFAAFGEGGVAGYGKAYPLKHARYSELVKDDIPAVDPNRLALEAPYSDEPLYWIEGEGRGASGPEPVWIPAQCVFLFCNLDEVKLFSALGSTGLASGNTMAEARQSALFEIIERDHEGVTPFHPSQCFTVETTDSQVGPLLENYRELGIHVQFQDLTSRMGVPCCKCFVREVSGGIVKGTGCHLDARRALLSAMTETPYAFPYGPPSGTGLHGLVRVPLENLPDYSLGNSAADLLLLETLLAAWGYTPVYVDLTRKDIGLPVVRAIVPGMEITADFDRFSRVHPRLFANYLRLFSGSRTAALR
jgi:YcaO-like protein with predicted kinase domain